MKGFFVRLSVFILLVTLVGLSAVIVDSGIYDESPTVAVAGGLDEYEVSFPVKTTFSNNIENNTCTVRYKLLGLFTVKKVDVTIVEKEYVYLGGMPIGISLKLGGLVVQGVQEVITDDGSILPVKDCGIQPGDKLIKVNGKEISGISVLASELAANNGEPMKLTLDRDTIEFDVLVTPAKDVLTGNRKLGLLLRESVDGIGTLSYVKSDKTTYGALGHAVGGNIKSKDTKGAIYPATVYGVKRGTNGTAGELQGAFNLNNPIGTIEVNNEFGIFGNIDAESVKQMMQIEVGGVQTAHVGKAYIYTSLQGASPSRYSIEIVKATYQTKPEEKGLAFKVTDERLLSSTGGVVQGMSGSPIVQDGKIIGAVSHVLLNDSTRGFGMYMDWMKEQY